MDFCAIPHSPLILPPFSLSFSLQMVPTQQLSKLSNLTYLNLGGNRFAHLPAVAFLNLFHLRELHLSRLDFLQRIDSR